MEQTTINNALHYVLDLLEPINHYPYHNINHTLDVYTRAGYLCDKEYIPEEEKTDVLIAALFHDTGFSRQYYQNEVIGAEIARNYLRSIDFPEHRIARIESLVMATVLFNEPKNLLECILQDADLDNLGRKDCFVKTLLVRKELNTIASANIPKEKWLNVSYNLLRNYNYHTLTSRDERESLKELNAEKMRHRLEVYRNIELAIETGK